MGAVCLVFGTDAPFGMDSLITDNTIAVDTILDKETNDALNFGNAERLLAGKR